MRGPGVAPPTIGVYIVTQQSQQFLPSSEIKLVHGVKNSRDKIFLFFLSASGENKIGQSDSHIHSYRF